MNTIYVPKGRAREYAPLAINLFKGCSHGCTYCFVPRMPWVSQESHREAHLRTSPEKFLHDLKHELDKKPYSGQVLLCFMTDPYTQFSDEKEGYDAALTRSYVFTALHNYGLSFCVLSKAGSRALADIDFYHLEDAYAATLTFISDRDSKKWEPNAALPANRLDTLERFHKWRIPTWASLEPVIDPQQTLELINIAYSHVDVFKIGVLNYDNWRNTIDWPAFAWQVVQKLEYYGYQRIYDPDEAVEGRYDNRLYYIKKDLAKYLEE